MVHSMTGFGKAEFTQGSNSFSIEIKCLNSKQQDVSIRMPSKYKSKELLIRNLLIGNLKRGKVELSIHVDSGSKKSGQTINTTVFNAYKEQLESIVGGSLSDEMLTGILKMPDVFSVEKEALQEDEWSLIRVNIEAAIKNVIEFRTAEGDNLEKDLIFRIENIEGGLENILVSDTARIQKVKDRIKNAVGEIEEKLIDKNRLEQELIYYLEKLDITEEKVRLKSHTDYFRQNLQQKGDKGKKLGFISQEIGREINTIGSKANDSAMQQIVVGMKDELEKIKEQLLNIL